MATIAVATVDELGAMIDVAHVSDGIADLAIMADFEARDNGLLDKYRNTELNKVIVDEFASLGRSIVDQDPGSAGVSAARITAYLAQLVENAGR